jgi:hypothetical protein
LHATEIDVADHRVRGAAIDIVLNEYAVFEHSDLGATLRLADDHDAVHRLATREELGLGEDGGATSPSITALAATLSLSFQTHRTLECSRLDVARAGLADVDGRALGILGIRAGVLAAAATTTAAAGR